MGKVSKAEQVADAIIHVARERGAVVERDGSGVEFVLMTVGGPLLVYDPRSKARLGFPMFAAMRFVHVDYANRVLGREFGHNPYSGKWNLHLGDASPLMWEEDLGRMLDRVLPVASVPAERTARTPIERDTPIVPLLVAEAVVGEVERHVGLPLARRRDVMDRLWLLAESQYAHDEPWAKRLRARGNRGRDFLYGQMRRWLALIVQYEENWIWWQLGSLRQSWSAGEPLPKGRKSAA